MRSLIKLGLASLFKKDENNGISIIAFLCVFISLPIIFLVALFSGGSSDAADPYEVAYSSTLCHPDYKYQLDDVRFFDSYTRKENDELKSDDILERLRNDYFIFRKSDSGKQVCILKPDEEIWDTLETKYHVKKKYKDEILETVLQLRNDRQNFETPISDYKILTNYEPSKKQEGITLSVEKDSSIRAIADGKIVEIKNSSSTYKTEIDGEEIEKEGLTVTIEHEVQQGLKENGDYKFIKMYTRYTNLKKVPWQLDQEIKQGKEIGISDKEYFHFQLMDKDKKAMDPNEYILFMSDDFEMPLEKPFSVTSLSAKESLMVFIMA